MVCSSFFENLIKQYNDFIAFHMEIEDIFYFVESNNLLKFNVKNRFRAIKQNLRTLINDLEITRVDAEEEHKIFGLLEDVSNLLRMLNSFGQFLDEIKIFHKYFAPLITQEHLVIVNKVESFEKQFTDLKKKFVKYCQLKDGNHYISLRKTTASPREIDRLSIKLL